MSSLFKYVPFTHPLDLSRSVAVGGYDSLIWTENYRSPSEFVITAKLDTGLGVQLPVGSLVSTIQSDEIMIVEDHSVVERKDASPELRITGRSLESILEGRVLGANQDWENTPPGSISKINVGSAPVANQVRDVGNDYIDPVQVFDPDDGVQDLLIEYQPPPWPYTPTLEARELRRQSVHAMAMDLLSIDDLGIQTLKPGRRRSYFSTSYPHVAFVIHGGEDLSSRVTFASERGDFDEVEFLQTQRKMRNAVLVSGQYVETRVTTGGSSINRRWGHITATDIDGYLSAPPTGTGLTTIRNKLAVRGREWLRQQTEIEIVRQTPAKRLNLRYRENYNIGDLVSISTGHGPRSVMRVTSNTEEISNGVYSSYPTLTALV